MMKKKQYSADDIKRLKPTDEYLKALEAVDISRDSFKRNLISAANYAVEFARTLVSNNLPNKIRYVVFLGASYDGNPLEEGECTFPEDYSQRERHFDESESVVNLLWRDGKVPEWINVIVQSETPEYTNVKLECCGRFSDKAENLYHVNEGRAPFHVLGPNLPQGYDLSSREKFDLKDGKKNS